MEKTLTYSESVKGWPSFYSFIPDMMCGMNNHFYTWKGGNLYVHNSDLVNRCYFYGVQYETYIKTVINDHPLENKLYKTIALIGTDSWDVLAIDTDLQSGGNIDSSWFEEKESSWFSYIRSASAVPAPSSEFPLRSVNGIGRSSIVSGTGANVVVDFALSVSIGTVISVGDYVYYALPPYTTPVLFGVVTNIQVNYPGSINRLTVDSTIGTIPGIQNAYIMSIKNQIAESMGILGHYAILELENSNTERIELFSVWSEVIKSFP